MWSAAVTRAKRTRPAELLGKANQNQKITTEEMHEQEKNIMDPALYNHHAYDGLYDRL